jgi:hypothetical protein
MVLVDYNGIAIGSIMGQLNRGEALTENLVKHIILNNIRLYRNKFKEDEWGKMIICCDDLSWRKSVYPEYKAARKTNRDKSKYDWSEIYRLLDIVTNDIKINFPYAVISVENAEADDIIGALTLRELDDPWGSKVAIVSADKDFIQLHMAGQVIQWSPMQQKMVKSESSPKRYLFDHILKGDSSDGVPNVLSPDNTFTDKIRQSPMTKKKMDLIWENRDTPNLGMDDNTYRNYCRNREMIDLTYTPKEIKEDSLRQLENYKYPMRGSIFNYLVENEMKMLLEVIEEF